jgi:hypothetical protein
MSANPRRNARKRIRPATRRRALELLAASLTAAPRRSYWRRGSRPISWLIWFAPD